MNLVEGILLLIFGVRWAASLSSNTPSSTPKSTAVVWFRDHALRVRDHEALYEALEESSAIIPVFLWKKDGFASGGTASDVFVAHGLHHLNQTLSGKIFVGSCGSEGYARALLEICRDLDAQKVYYMESHQQELEDSIRSYLSSHRIRVRSFPNGHTLLDCDTLKGLPWKEIIGKHPFKSPLIPFVDYVCNEVSSSSKWIPQPQHPKLQESLENTPDYKDHDIMRNLVGIDSVLNVVGTVATHNGRIDWGSTIAKRWPVSELAAETALTTFLQERSSDQRTHFSSFLSPYLARGLLSPRQVYWALHTKGDTKALDSFVRRIGWRDYTYAVVSLFPDVIHGVPIRDGYDNHTTQLDSPRDLLKVWKEGQTGFPIVDAGMRQLKTEGWMPQKVRLVVATCLVEGLNGSWKDGMDHFAEYLVDYDPAINSNMWMNAGCVGFDPYYVGADYKRRPYWDAKGTYVRTWCPELAGLPDACEVPEAQRGIGTMKVDCLYEPWLAPPSVLKTSGVIIGTDYPHKCCDERTNRKTFFEKLRNCRASWPSSKLDEKGRDRVQLGRDPSAESIGMYTPKVLMLPTKQ